MPSRQAIQLRNIHKLHKSLEAVFFSLLISLLQGGGSVRPKERYLTRDFHVPRQGRTAPLPPNPRVNSRARNIGRAARQHVGRVLRGHLRRAAGVLAALPACFLPAAGRGSQHQAVRASVVLLDILDWNASLKRFRG